jgi:DNA-binding XRE family transcriptional regulator
VSRRLRVVSGIPLLQAASRCEMLAEAKASVSAREIPRDCCSGVSMWSTVVPTWNIRKKRHADGLSHYGVFRFLIRVYVDSMSNNKREHSLYSDAVASQVRAERAAADITQKQIVALSGLSRSTYVRIEDGVHVADTSELARICGAYGMSVLEFIHRVEERIALGKNGKS